MKDLHSKLSIQKESNNANMSKVDEERIAVVEEKMEECNIKCVELEQKVIKLDKIVTKKLESQPLNHPKLLCRLCGFVCERKLELKKHKEEKHKATFALKHCKLCSETFQQNWQLEDHLKSHNEAEKFDCKTCGKIFLL